MELTALRRKFLDYFAAQGYQPHAPSSLIPHNDPSVLFTTAGMQQFRDFYLNPDQAPAAQLATVQPVIRTSDISEVGDDTHLTMFEMLGIFSFGQRDIAALKKTAITAMWTFVRDELKVEKNRVHATVFAGDKQIPADETSANVWAELGVPIKKHGRDDNFWGPTGESGPCGPNTELFVDNIEVGNLVFNEYQRDAEHNFTPLSQVGLDFGAGLERLSATLQGQDSVWQIEPFASWAAAVEPSNPTASRVIIDHLKAIIFLVGAGVEPSNKGQGYVLRRLMRKAVFLASQVDRPLDWAAVLYKVRVFYGPAYPDLPTAEAVLAALTKEKDQFERNLERAKSHLERWLKTTEDQSVKAITDLAFFMYESFGFPKELVVEYLKSVGATVDLKHFDVLFARHQAVSRSGLTAQFKGGLADHQPQTVKHHTAHHLLLAALQQVLGQHVVQKGSNVTSERLRLDFNFDRKLTDGELKKVEAIVNQKIADDLPVEHTEMPKAEALALGAQAEFGQKYGDVVSVYTVKNQDGSVFSRELCGGPHVARTGELGHFSILKEEASSQGVRRIKAKV